MDTLFQLMDAWFPTFLVVSSGLLTVAGIYDNIKNGPRNREPLKAETRG